MPSYSFRKELADMPCFDFEEGLHALITRMNRIQGILADQHLDEHSDLDIYDLAQLLTAARWVEGLYKKAYESFKRALMEEMVKLPVPAVQAFAAAWETGHFAPVFLLMDFEAEGGK